MRLFCGKWPTNIGHPMGLRHPVWVDSSNQLKSMDLMTHMRLFRDSYEIISGHIWDYFVTHWRGFDHSCEMISSLSSCAWAFKWLAYVHTITLTPIAQHSTHCNTLQHTVTHCNTLQQIIGICAHDHLDTYRTRFNTLQHTATHCNTRQHTATHCTRSPRHPSHTVQHTATHCNTL